MRNTDIYYILDQPQEAFFRPHFVVFKDKELVIPQG